MTSDTETKIKGIIIKLCESLNTKISNNAIYKKEKLDNLFSTYSQVRDELRKNMRDPSKLDRHKLAALVCVSVMHHSPFSITSTNASPLARNANFIIAIKAGLSLIASFNAREDVKIDPQYLKDFIRLLHDNKRLLVNVASSSGTQNIDLIFFISHIYFFIEKCEIMPANKYIEYYVKSTRTLNKFN